MTNEIWLIGILAFIGGIALGYFAASSRGGKENAVLRERIESRDREMIKKNDTISALTAKAEESERTSIELRTRFDGQESAFQMTAKTALTESRADFLREANEKLSPINTNLKQMSEILGALELKRESAYTAMNTKLDTLNEAEVTLRTQTEVLLHALRSPTQVGKWGEVQLRNVIEMAGMTEHCDFDSQVSVASSEHRRRPDAIIKLPSKRHIVVDAKAPLAEYLNAATAVDDATRASHLREFVSNVRGHVRDLARKEYWDPEFWQSIGDAAELVVLFLPGEAFFSSALREDPELIEYSVSRRVFLASPLTLVSMLKAIYVGWREERLAETALEISRLGAELYKRLGVEARHISDVGKHLEKCVVAYNSAVTSLESRVFTQARKFENLGASGTVARIGELSAIDAAVRMLNAPETRATLDDSRDENANASIINNESEDAVAE